MKTLRSILASLALASACVAQPLPAQPEAQPASREQVQEWVKQMRIDGTALLKEGDAALAKGDEKTALNKYTAAHEIYKAAFTVEELKKMADDITRLRAKLGVPDHSQATLPAKNVDLNDPVIASKRGDGLRLLSEAEQYLEEGKYFDAGKLFTRIYSRYNDALLAEEEQRVNQGLMTARERLGLPPLPAGQIDHMPYVARSGDDEIDSLCVLFAGTFATDPKAMPDAPVLHFNAAAVPVKGLSNAIYFEVSRADDPAHPFRQGIFSFLRLDTQLRLRVLDISSKHHRDALVGLWAVSDVFPELPIEALSINADLVCARNDDGSGYTARTQGRVPTLAGGAVLMTSQIRMSADGITIDDRGFNAAGAEVWRSGPETGIAFGHTVSPGIVTRKESGVVLIDLVPGRGDTPLVRAGELAMHFSYWSANGNLINTSRVADRPPQRVRFPINFIKGLDEGLDGITAGTQRRVFIPSDLAWGDQGNGWQAPPNTPIVFDVECLWVQQPVAPPAIPSAPTEEGPTAPTTPPAGGGH